MAQSRKVNKIFGGLDVLNFIDSNNHRLLHVALPSEDTDGVNKLYVDTIASGATANAGYGLTKTGNILSVNNTLPNLTGVGNINDGTWSADTISVNYGGTGTSSFLSNKLIMGNGTNPLQTVSGLSVENDTFNSSIGVNFSNTTNATNATAGGSLTVRGGASIEKNLIIGGNLTAQNATIQNLAIPGTTTFNNIQSLSSSFTNLSVSNLLTTNCTLNNLILSSLTATSGSFYNSTITSTYINNSTIGQLYSANSTLSNLFFNNGTGSNLYITNFTGANSISSRSTISTSIITNSTAANLFLTNATSNNIFLNNSTISNNYITYLTCGSGFINSGTANTLYINYLTSGSTYLNNSTINNLYGNNITIANAYSINTSVSNLNITYLTSGSSYLTNATSSNMYIDNSIINNNSVNNLYTTNGTISNLQVSSNCTINNIYTNFNTIGSLNVISGIATDLSITNTTVSNLRNTTLNSNSATVSSLYSNNSTISNLYGSTVTANSLYVNTLNSNNLIGTFNTLSNAIITNLSSSNLNVQSQTNANLYSLSSNLLNVNITNASLEFSNMNATSIANLIVSNTGTFKKQVNLGGFNFNSKALATSGALLNVNPYNFTDTTTTSSNTQWVSSYFSTPTLSGQFPNITTTKAATVYIQGKPLAGPNQTINNSANLALGYVSNTIGSTLTGQIMFERYDGNWFTSMYVDNFNQLVINNASADSGSTSGTAGIGMYVYQNNPITFASIPNVSNITPTPFIQLSANTSTFYSTTDSTSLTSASVVFNGGISVAKRISASSGSIGNLFSSNFTTSNLQVVNVTVTNITSTNALLSNITSTNILSTNITSTSILSTNITSTNLQVNDGILTNLTNSNLLSSNITTTNLQVANGTLTSITSTNLLSTNVISQTVSTGTIYTDAGILGPTFLLQNNYIDAVVNNQDGFTASNTILFIEPGNPGIYGAIGNNSGFGSGILTNTSNDLMQWNYARLIIRGVALNTSTTGSTIGIQPFILQSISGTMNTQQNFNVSDSGTDYGYSTWISPWFSTNSVNALQSLGIQLVSITTGNTITTGNVRIGPSYLQFKA